MHVLVSLRGLNGTLVAVIIYCKEVLDTVYSAQYNANNRSRAQWRNA